MVEGPLFCLMTQAPDVFGFQNLKEMNIVGGEEMC
jgi:hypothetical protein